MTLYLPCGSGRDDETIARIVEENIGESVEKLCKELRDAGGDLLAIVKPEHVDQLEGHALLSVDENGKVEHYLHE